VRLGIARERLRLRPHDADELSHYSSATSDVEYLYPIGWSELEGIANRGDFDLTQHARHSGERLEYHDPQSGERYVPHVIEPAAGVGRSVLAFLCDAYDEDEIGGEKRTVLRLHPTLAPVKVAVLPLLRKDGHPELAREVYEDLRRRLPAEYDEGGAIGRRYRRQDEIGTPFAVTIDHRSLEDRTVTLRERDSLAQDRVAIDALAGELARRLAT
jgi:glycyl-tRNA synthetase